MAPRPKAPRALNPSGNWIEISESALTANFRTLREAAGCDLLAVIKANAYGHSAQLCAPILARAGTPFLGVTSAAEGAAVRQSLASAKPEILIMCGSLPADTGLIHQHNLTPVVWTETQIAQLAALPQGTPIHLEIDTGMGRQGVSPGPQLAGALQQIASTGLLLDGVFTHFCSSEIAGSHLTARQQALFEQAVTQLRASGVIPTWLHAGNTSTVDSPDPHAAWLRDLAATLSAGDKTSKPMLRGGLGLYGYALPIEHSLKPPRTQTALIPVLTWRAAVIACRDLAPGETVGYNATFTAQRPMRTALLPVGYADGLRRELSNRSWVMIHGQRAPIIGRVSMNLTVVDVTHIPAVQPGTEATLLGPGITAADHATFAGTIPYEILCSLQPTPKSLRS